MEGRSWGAIVGVADIRHRFTGPGGADIQLTSAVLWTDRLVVHAVESRPVRADRLHLVVVDGLGRVIPTGGGGGSGLGANGSEPFFSHWSFARLDRTVVLPVRIGLGQGRSEDIHLRAEDFAAGSSLEVLQADVPEPPGQACDVCGRAGAGVRGPVWRRRCGSCREGDGALARVHSSRRPIPLATRPVSATVMVPRWGPLTLVMIEEYDAVTTLHYHLGRGWTAAERSPIRALLVFDDRGVEHDGFEVGASADEHGWTGFVALGPPVEPGLRRLRFVARAAGRPVLEVAADLTRR